MNVQTARRLNLSPVERDVLRALRRPEQRWWTAAQVADRLVLEIPVVLSALNTLRRRDLATAKVPSISRDTLWTITTLGDGELAAGTQLTLAPEGRIVGDAGGGWRNA